MKSLLGKLGVLFVGLLIFGNTEAWGADWRFLLESVDYYFYYDAESITRPSKNSIRLWHMEGLYEAVCK